MIYWMSQGKRIALNGENNNKQVFDNIAKRRYTHLFTSLEKILLKRFKYIVLDHTFFIDCLVLLAVDEIYLVEE